MKYYSSGAIVNTYNMKVRTCNNILSLSDEGAAINTPYRAKTSA